MRKTVMIASLLAASLAYAAGPALKTDNDKTIYALGFLTGQNISMFGLSKAELEIAKKGFGDGATGAKAEVPVDDYKPKLQQLAQARSSAKADAEKEKSKGFLDKAASEKGAVKTASGLVFTELKPGTGPSPSATDKVKVNYRGTLIDGKEFDSSYKRGQPAEFGLNQVIPCWTEGVQKMKVGGKAKLVCPSSIAYGDRGHPPVIPPGATLTFDIELLSIEK
jgi:FKBP-type peptidyl-prolyl cis-trans isomerase